MDTNISNINQSKELIEKIAKYAEGSVQTKCAIQNNVIESKNALCHPTINELEKIIDELRTDIRKERKMEEMKNKINYFSPIHFVRKIDDFSEIRSSNEKLEDKLSDIGIKLLVNKLDKLERTSKGNESEVRKLLHNTNLTSKRTDSIDINNKELQPFLRNNSCWATNLIRAKIKISSPTKIGTLVNKTKLKIQNNCRNLCPNALVYRTRNYLLKPTMADKLEIYLIDHKIENEAQMKDEIIILLLEQRDEEMKLHCAKLKTKLLRMKINRKDRQVLLLNNFIEHARNVSEKKLIELTKDIEKLKSDGRGILSALRSEYLLLITEKENVQRRYIKCRAKEENKVNSAIQDLRFYNASFEKIINHLSGNFELKDTKRMRPQKLLKEIIERNLLKIGK
ncbi:uncharacterized protein LOC111622327 isoform X2 [Centruroides sculpturatus]|uniref:uncharacterized protein LOC111622327 isoform X2 n=1 Tax=Centruroides sculpturatus TaxID=218467 RepID=UPI000C6D018E|nr:uncharacterized protein LOC111622327 isoform X2 [Centruroides sculpturatus]